MTNEELVVEVAEWLEKAAHSTDLVRVAKWMVERKPNFVIFNIVLHFDVGNLKGVEHIVKHPVKDFQSAVGLTDEDMNLLRDFVATNSDSAIKIWFEVEEGEEFLCLSQINYVPQDHLEQAQYELATLIARLCTVSNISVEDLSAKIDELRQKIKGSQAGFCGLNENLAHFR